MLASQLDTKSLDCEGQTAACIIFLGWIVREVVYA